MRPGPPAPVLMTGGAAILAALVLAGFAPAERGTPRADVVIQEAAETTIPAPALKPALSTDLEAAPTATVGSGGQEQSAAPARPKEDDPRTQQTESSCDTPLCFIARDSSLVLWLLFGLLIAVNAAIMVVIVSWRLRIAVGSMSALKQYDWDGFRRLSSAPDAAAEQQSADPGRASPRSLTDYMLLAIQTLDERGRQQDAEIARLSGMLERALAKGAFDGPGGTSHARYAEDRHDPAASDAWMQTDSGGIDDLLVDRPGTTTDADPARKAADQGLAETPVSEPNGLDPEAVRELVAELDVSNVSRADFARAVAARGGWPTDYTDNGFGEGDERSLTTAVPLGNDIVLVPSYAYRTGFAEFSTGGSTPMAIQAAFDLRYDATRKLKLIQPALLSGERRGRLTVARKGELGGFSA